MQVLTQESDSWKQEAEDLLAKSKLNDVLDHYGETIITGSFSYDLMLSPDIDIYLITESPEQTSTSLLQELIKQRFWNGYLFYDWLHFRSNKHPGFPKSFYVGLKATHNNHRWKVDIWTLNSDAYHEKDDDWVSAKLTNETKALILKLKKERNDKHLDIPSYQIYDAVLNHGTNSLKGLENE